MSIVASHHCRCTEIIMHDLIASPGWRWTSLSNDCRCNCIVLTEGIWGEGGGGRVISVLCSSSSKSEGGKPMRKLGDDSEEWFRLLHPANPHWIKTTTKKLSLTNAMLFDPQSLYKKSLIDYTHFYYFAAFLNRLFVSDDVLSRDSSMADVMRQQIRKEV